MNSLQHGLRITTPPREVISENIRQRIQRSFQQDLWREKIEHKNKGDFCCADTSTKITLSLLDNYQIIAAERNDLTE